MESLRQRKEALLTYDPSKTCYYLVFVVRLKVLRYTICASSCASILSTYYIVVVNSSTILS